MNGRTYSVTTPGDMFSGEQVGNEYLADGDPPFQTLNGESNSIRACGGSGEGKEGNGVESDGFPEDVGFERNEKNALAERIEELEMELNDYQYHMGLLLIEKKMRTSEFEEVREGLAEARANLKLERAAFSSTLSEKQKQVQSILIALEAEKQRVADLEETIYKMQAEENYLTDQRETLQSWEPSLQDHKLELKRSHNIFGERNMNITNEKEVFSEMQEEVEETQNSFVRMNNASNYREASFSDRQQNLASKEKEAERKQEKLEKKERDLLATQALQSEKQAFDQELESERQSLDGELKNMLINLGKRQAVEGEYGSPIIDDLLAHKKEVETDKVKVQEDKEALNALYNRLQKFKQELTKKRDLLLSLPEHCKACMNCSIICSAIDLASLETFEGAELAGDIPSLSFPNEHLEKNRMKGQNDDSFPMSKGYQSVKRGGSMTCFQQCSELCNFNSRGRGLYPTTDGNERKATEVESRSQSMPVISHDILHNKRVEPTNEARKIEIIEKFSKAVHSLEECSETANDALEIECQPNASPINEQNESHALSTKYKERRSRPNKRTGSLKVVVGSFEDTPEDIPKEIKQLKKCGSEDLKDANEQSKLNFLNADKMRGGTEQWELLCHSSRTTTFEIDSCDRTTQPACEGHHKRQRTSEIRLSFPGQRRYNFRPSTILKDLISKLQSKHVELGRDSDETDIDYEPSNSG